MIEAYISRADVHFYLGEYVETINDTNRVLELDPYSSDGYALRGSALDGIGRSRDAISDFSIALGLNPEHSLLWINRGIAYAKIGEFDLALLNLETYLELDTDSPEEPRVQSMIDTLKSDIATQE